MLFENLNLLEFLVSAVNVLFLLIVKL